MKALCCVEAREVSALYWMVGLHSSGGRERTLEVDNGAQERKIIGGSQQVSERLRQLIGADRVITGHPVASIDWDAANADAAVVMTCRDGSTYRALQVVVALSPPLYSTLRFTPPLPLQKAQPASRMYGGSIIKVLTRYRSPFWRTRGYSGELFDTAGHIVSGGYDDCQEPDGQAPYFGLIGFIVGDTARHWMKRSREERRTAVCAQYSEVFECEEALQPLDYVEHDWSAEEFSRGGYNAVFPPSVLTTVQHQLTAPLADRVHFAASELAVHWAGYMSGALESGDCAAHAVLQQLGKVEGEFEVEVAEEEEWECRARPVERSWIEPLLPSLATVRYACVAVAATGTALLAWRLRRP